MSLCVESSSSSWHTAGVQCHYASGLAPVDRASAGGSDILGDVDGTLLVVPSEGLCCVPDRIYSRLLVSFYAPPRGLRGQASPHIPTGTCQFCTSSE